MPDIYAESVADTRLTAESAPRSSQTTEPRPDVANLDRVYQSGLTTLYGADWESAGQRLAQAFSAEGPAAYERLARTPEAFGTVVGDRSASEGVANGLWAREQVLASARGVELPGSFRSPDATTGGADQSLEREPPTRLRPGEHLPFTSTLARAVPAGDRSGINGSAPVPFGPAYTPLAISVRGNVSVDLVRTVDGRQAAEVTVSAYTQTGTNAYGRVNNIFTGGRLVEVTPRGDGRTIPFTLRPAPNGVRIPDSPGGSRALGATTLVVPVGRTYRAEFDVATNLPARGARLATKTYESGEFTPVGPNAR